MKGPARVNVKRCPHCGNADITFEGGFVTGVYWCPKCDYRGTLVIEEDLARGAAREE